MGGDSSIILYLQQSLGGRILDSHAFRGDETIVITREGLLEIFRLLKEDPKLDFNFLTDITAVDYLGKKEPRFEVVYHFYSFRAKHRLRVKVGVPEEDPIGLTGPFMERGQLAGAGGLGYVRHSLPGPSRLNKDLAL